MLLKYNLKVFNESGVGSILDVQDHYENNVIKQHFRLIEQCRWRLSLSLLLTLFSVPENLSTSAHRALADCHSIPSTQWPYRSNYEINLIKNTSGSLFSDNLSPSHTHIHSHSLVVQNHYEINMINTRLIEQSRLELSLSFLFISFGDSLSHILTQTSIFRKSTLDWNVRTCNSSDKNIYMIITFSFSTPIIYC